MSPFRVLYFPVLLTFFWILDISLAREDIQVGVDNNISGVPNCNRCSVEFLKFSKLEQILWKKYIDLDFAVGGPLVQNFQTIHFAVSQVYDAGSQKQAIESLPLEENNLLNFYFNDLKLSPEEIHEKLRNLYQKISLTRGWQQYHKSVKDDKEYAKLTNQPPEPTKAESRQFEAISNFTENTTDKHVEL